MDKKNIIINIKKKKFDLNTSDIDSSSENDKIDNIPKITTEKKFINGMEIDNINLTKNKFVNGILSDEEIKSKDLISKYHNKSSYPVKLNNDIDNYSPDENEEFTKTFLNKNSPSFTESNYVKHKNNSKLLMRNYSMNNYINTTFHNNIDNSIITNNNNVLLIDNNKSTHADRLDPKNAIKINRIKDEYIDFLQKQYEDKAYIRF